MLQLSTLTKLAASQYNTTGFVEHIKLPHYVDFQSELELVRQMRRDAAALAEAAAE